MRNEIFALDLDALIFCRTIPVGATQATSTLYYLQATDTSRPTY
jgi:hypothetical protein